MYLLKDKNALRSPMMRMTKSVAPKYFRFWGQPQFYDSPAVDAQAVPREQVKAYWDKLCAFHQASSSASKAALSLPAALEADGAGATITYAPALTASSSTSASAAGGQQSGGRARNHRASRSGRGRDYHHRSQVVEENGVANDYLQQKFQ